jgi:hypothetical protein
MNFMPLDLIQVNLFSPMVLAFFLGIAAVLGRSDLKFPEAIYTFLSTYLLLAIGLKGGAALRADSFLTIWKPVLATFLLGVTLPVGVFFIARLIFSFSRVDAAALAAHYGSVSVVTFLASQVFVEQVTGQSAEGFMPALVAILEVPGILIALLLAEQKRYAQGHSTLLTRFRNIIFSKSILLLWGGLLIGYISGKTGLERVAPFFVHPFQGVLVLFLLDMGVVAGSRLADLKDVRLSLLLFALITPVLSGLIGVWAGTVAGLSLSGATVMGTMAASASYIAAPAAVKISLPNANPAYYLTASLLITFPFNLAFGIPLYHQMASLLR